MIKCLKKLFRAQAIFLHLKKFILSFMEQKHGTYASSTVTASGTYSLSVPANGFAFIEEN